MNPTRTLHTVPAGNVKTLSRPEIDEVVTLKSPARQIFTDFTHHDPIVIDGDLSIEQAGAFMQRSHVKLTLVIDVDDQFLGVLSFSDLNGQRYQHLFGQGFTKEDITVKDVMIPGVELRAISYEDIENSSIGCIVDTLKQEHRQHFLVMDKQPKIRGIFSASDIARRLHVPIDISQAPTFADICHVMFSQTRH